MKKYLLLVLLLMSSSSILFGQDIIILKDGSELKGKVTEIGLNEIKYRKVENLEGPAYVLDKAEIFMILYENGKKDVFVETKQEEQEKDTLQKYSTEDGFLDVNTRRYTIAYFKNDHLISRKEYVSIIKGNPLALRKYRSGRAMRIIGRIIGAPAAFIFGYQIGSLIGGGKGYNETAFIVSSLFFASGITLNLTGSSRVRKSATLYNSDLKKQTSQLYLGLGYTINGIGITLNF